tara:strand:- start:23935 stop:25014 length:1080 start_codon:yes stop_codon:yes gene_type:complete
MGKTYIIAEAGVNHNGNSELAFKLIDKGIEAGADAIKFQIFKADNLATDKSDKAQYQLSTTNKHESQLTMLKSLELPLKTYIKLKEYCEKLGADFLITAFDSTSLNFIINKLNVSRLKIPSGEITNGPLILQHAQSGLDIIMSTGMANLNEIQDALSIISYGYNNQKPINSVNFKKIIEFNKIEKPKISLKDKVTLLHCTTEYPAPIDELNLKAIQTLKDTFGLMVGYSDHSEGILASIIASSFDIKIIEKHFTLDKTMAGPDHKASLEPDELKLMIESIRNTENIMGAGEKKASPSEIKNIFIARKSLVALINIKKGDSFSEKNLTAKRSGNGISPMKFWEFIGKKACRDYLKDEIIE